MKELILGGARSGKSVMAEQRAQASGLELVYIATGQGGDSEMSDRIAHHRQRRGEQWTLVEEPIMLAQVLQEQASDQRCLLVDCLTLWLSNCMLADDTTTWAAQREALLAVLQTLPGHIIMVSNEVSMGLVAMEALSRQFVDQSGWLHQQLAQRCDRVTLSVAGLPHTLKGQAPITG
ncbi:MAG: adenosylcobinamide kinase/adenosylcobinamide-phosphate guanylyltransferase [Paraglaciecola psychrophila]